MSTEKRKLEKHGLTSEDVALLERHLEFHEELHFGKREPETMLQRHFVMVATNFETLSPITPHERAYVKYLRRKKGLSTKLPVDTKPDYLASTESKNVHGDPKARLINQQQDRWGRPYKR